MNNDKKKIPKILEKYIIHFNGIQKVILKFLILKNKMNFSFFL